MQDVRCRGCRRRIGVTRSHGYPFRQTVWCSDICASEEPAYEGMEREDLWNLLLSTGGWTVTRLAQHWGIGYPVISRAMARRRSPT